MAMTQNESTHPGRAARLTMIGAPAPRTGPRYGMKRSAAPSTPHTSGYGTPRKYSPSPAMVPYTALTSDCINSWRLTRLPASSNALVVTVRRPSPNQPDQPIAQVAAFEQHEDHERHHERRGSQRAHQRTQPRKAWDAGRGVGGDDHLLWRFPLQPHRSCSRSVLISSIVSCSFSTVPPLPAPRTSSIFARMLTR